MTTIQITTTNHKSYEGEVFAIDPVTRSVVLKHDGSFIIINPAQIHSINGDIHNIKAPDCGKLGISLVNVEKKEEAAWRLAESRLAALNTGVPDDIQILFDKLSFIFPCKWKGTSIIVLDEYVIEAPYHAVKVLPGANESGMARVVKIFEGERKKLNL